MKKTILICTLAPMMAFGAQVKTPAKPTKPVASQVITTEQAIEQERARQKFLIEGIQRLAKEQQLELDAIKLENERVQQETFNAQLAHQEAQTQVDLLQIDINTLTKDRNAQAAQKDKAMQERDYWHNKQQEAVKKLWKWRIMGGLGVAAAGIFALLQFTSMGAKVAAKFARPF